MSRFEFYVEKMPAFMFAERLHIVYRAGRPDGDDLIVGPLQTKKLERHMPPGDWNAIDETVERNGPVVRDFLQAALDCAWKLGLRPGGIKDHTDELAAVRYHLEDMRVLAKLKPRQAVPG